MKQTYCNPLDLGYRYQHMKEGPRVAGFREGADPTLVFFKEKYYLFVSMSAGFWYSDDLVRWDFHPDPDLLIYDYAPDVRQVGEYLYFCASRKGQNCPILRSKDPLHEPFEEVSAPFAFWDPDLFRDDDGRVYLYWGCSNTTPIWGVEMDPETMMPIGEKKELIFGQEETLGYERPGDNGVVNREASVVYQALRKHYNPATGKLEFPPEMQHVPGINTDDLAAMFFAVGKPYIEGAYTPSWFNFPGENGITEYREGVFVGYRYYDAKEMDVLFPFGYGLSYTSFAYSNMTVDRSRMREGETLRVQLTVANTGKLPGKEVVQLYVAPPAGMRRRPVRELKSFAKVALQPGERREITFQLNARDLAYYEPLLHDFYALTGCYGIEVGASSRDIRLRKEVSFTAERPLPRMFTEYSTLADVVSDPKGAAVFGPILQRLAEAAAGQASAGDTEGASRMLEGMTLGTLVSFGVLTEEQLKGMLEGLNG